MSATGRRRCIFAWFSLLATVSACVPSSAPDPPKAATIAPVPTPVSAMVRAPLQAVSTPQTLLDRVTPEWLLMLVAIARGEAMGPQTGWYKPSFGESRFADESMLSEFDRNHDGKIDVRDWSGSEDDFATLDRDRDGLLTPADIQSPKMLNDRAAIEAFALADRNADGKVAPDELAHFSNAASGDPVQRIQVSKIVKELGTSLLRSNREDFRFLAHSDFQEAFDGTTSASASDGPKLTDRGLILRSFLRQEIGNWSAGPNVGNPAPPFLLERIDDGPAVSLLEAVGEQPIVLIFGNFTCSPFRSHSGSLESLRKRYGKVARFFIVYTRESHPRDGWKMEDNSRDQIDVEQPVNLEARRGVASACRKALDLKIPVLVDTMDDAVSRLYSGVPSRLYLINRAGIIAYKSGRGPFGFKPTELERSLILLLKSSHQSTDKGDGTHVQEVSMPGHVSP